MSKVNNKCTKIKYEIGPSLTITTNVTDVVFESLLLTLNELLTFKFNFEPDFIYWANSACYFFIKKLCPKFWTKWTNNPYKSCCFSQENFLQPRSLFSTKSNIWGGTFLVKIFNYFRKKYLSHWQSLKCVVKKKAKTWEVYI